ncbi:MAG: hypothetical protein LKI53_00870 [Bacteroidales bacterium]|jgi:phage repressor protein C with HTH and peptisase S24 domain|nr:hypothetical protein [Bacteroidales bacterium]
MQENKQKVSPIKQRILEFAKTLYISKRSFYKSVGISRGTLETNTGITEEVMAKFIAAYPEVSVEWLIEGTAPMLKTPGGSHSKSRGDITGYAKAGFAGIPLIPADAAEEILSGKGSREILGEARCEHYTIPAFKGAEFLIRVKEESMEPKYYPGDIIACRHIKEDTFFQWNKVYIISTSQGLLIKRIRKGSDSGHLMLISENTDYSAFEISIKEIDSLALVLGIIRAE